MPCTSLKHEEISVLTRNLENPTTQTALFLEAQVSAKPMWALDILNFF